MKRPQLAGILSIFSLVSACGADTGPAAEEDSAAELSSPAALRVGIASSLARMFDDPNVERFLASTGGAPQVRIAHVYTPWNVALGTSPERDNLEVWLAKASALGVEPLVSFEHSVDARGGVHYPSVGQFEDAFTSFRRTWPKVVRFTAWNEPNGAPELSRSVRTAAGYYLAAARHCHAQTDGCLVAAGDFRGVTESDTADLASPHGPDFPACDPSGSFMDQYKCWIDRDGKGHRPTAWALHPYRDVDAYELHHAHCNGSECQTKRFFASLAGSWRGSEIWITETGALYASPALPEDKNSGTRQACAGAFLLRLLESDPRVTRLYYYNWIGGSADRGLAKWAPPGQPNPVRPIYDVLRDRRTRAGTCP